MWCSCPDLEFQVYIDLEEVSSGSLEEDFDILPPKKIKDPKATKPEDWDERAKIPDPEDVKPAGWDDIPATIPDKEATKPEDWDEEEDGKKLCVEFIWNEKCCKKGLLSLNA